MEMDGWMDGKVDRKSVFCWPPVEWEKMEIMKKKKKSSTVVVPQKGMKKCWELVVVSLHQKLVDFVDTPK
jgi:hypothetical protein